MCAVESKCPGLELAASLVGGLDNEDIQDTIATNVQRACEQCVDLANYLDDLIVFTNSILKEER